MKLRGALARGAVGAEGRKWGGDVSIFSRLRGLEERRKQVPGAESRQKTGFVAF